MKKISAELINSLLEYIENAEEIVDGEWGSCREKAELIEDGCMPEAYDKLLAIKNK